MPDAYVMRVAPEEEAASPGYESASQGLIESVNPDFARRHVPKLLNIGPFGEGEERRIVSLHTYVGKGSARYVTVQGQPNHLLQLAQGFSKGLLEAWALPTEMADMSPFELLIDAVGERRTDECLAVADDYFDHGDGRPFNGHYFRNPTAVASRVDTNLRVMRAVSHGDLHTRNLMIPQDDARCDEDDYWMVDVGQARRSVAGFDLAYFEVSVIVNNLKDMRLPELASCLKAAEDPSVSAIPNNRTWLVDYLRRSRAGIGEWMSKQPGRAEWLGQQIMLCRIAAGMTWSRRFRDNEHLRGLCLAYAGWYTLLFEQLYSPVEADCMFPQQAKAETEKALAKKRLWESFWSKFSGFAPDKASYVLVAERLPHTKAVGALGHLPWSIVVDLDPKSDTEGLHHIAGPVMNAQRSVHMLTSQVPVIDFARGTGWLFVGGSAQLGEPHLDLRQWQIQRLDRIRSLCTSLHNATGEKPVRVVILEGGTPLDDVPDRARTLKIVDTIDERLQARAEFYSIGLGQLESAVVPIEPVPLPVEDFVELMTQTLGSTNDYIDYALPAIDHGTAVVPPERMQTLREHLVILHDGIANSEPPGERSSDAFWRGGTISWRDLDLGLDVVRTVNADLVADLRENLEQHKTRTIILEHRPGSGGTTAALRAAWDLHHQYPVALIPSGTHLDQRRIRTIAERLGMISNRITQLPVLLVAESDDLTPSNLDALFRELSSRSTRVTILYVRRSSELSKGNPHQLSDPLDEEETTAFFARYTGLVDDEDRRTELALLGTEAYKQFRSPFFYGLITFEREFGKLSSYVHSHLRAVSERVSEVIEFLALVTIYSNTGLQPELLQKLLGIPKPSADLRLEDLLGPDAARLAVERFGKVRLQHQYVAEQALQELLGEHWKSRLSGLAIRFIEALDERTGLSSEPVRILLRQMFVDRQGISGDGYAEKEKFSPLIEDMDPSSAHLVLENLTQHAPDEPHFWNHLGRHQINRKDGGLEKAEEYLLKAVSLAEHDYVHHHMLGVVRLRLMKSRIDKATRSGMPAVMAVVREWYRPTVENFERTRELNPDNSYGYITHVQAVVTVAKALKSVARVSSVAELTAEASEWVTENLAEANSLLSQVDNLYKPLDRNNSFVDRCKATIKELYGEMDQVVELWELAAARSSGSPTVQRALAQAYFIRGERSWRNLNPAELARVADLARANMSKNGAKEEDYRLWFESYKMLEDFDVDEALSLLQQWVDRNPSWRAHYYRYCLLFHRWFTGAIDDYRVMEREQQQAERFVVGKSKRSFLWLSYGPDWFPMIAETDLGDWDRRKTFWSDTSNLLRVNGIIDMIHTPRKGYITLDGPVTAFFAPRDQFLQDSDENKPVNFFLGISPEGLRAWDPQPGHVEGAAHARHGGPRDLEYPEAQMHPVAFSPVMATTQADAMTDRKRLEFCNGLLEARKTTGDRTMLSELVRRVGARFQYDPVDLDKKLRRSRKFLLIPADNDFEVRLVESTGAPIELSATPRSGDTGELGVVDYIDQRRSNGSIDLVNGGKASFRFDDVAESARTAIQRKRLVRIGELKLDPRGGTKAHAIQVLPVTDSIVDGELVPIAELLDRIETDLRVELEERLTNDRHPADEQNLIKWLEQRFIGPVSLLRRLGLYSSDDLWRQFEWLEVKNMLGERKVGLRDRGVFGRARVR
ncbi:MAG TPA: hypothetical protein VFU12_01630 [Glycomyces sp.]|nr:hypothetical protein [Glycomyces sp.]